MSKCDHQRYAESVECRDCKIEQLQAENARLKRIIDPHIDADGNFDKQGFDWAVLEEIERLKELILQGEDFIEEEWQTVRSFGVLRAKQWYGGMMDEIAKIKAAPPQKGQENE